MGMVTSDVFTGRGGSSGTVRIYYFITYDLLHIISLYHLMVFFIKYLYTSFTFSKYVFFSQRYNLVTLIMGK